VGAVVSAAESQQGPLHDRFNREGRFPFGAWLMQAFRQMTTRLAEGVGCDGVGRVGELRRDLTWRRSEQATCPAGPPPARNCPDLRELLSRFPVQTLFAFWHARQA
jgi:hypothetical protein